MNNLIGITIYVLCAATSFVCAFLLFRGYGRTRMPLLRWSGLYFSSQVVANVILVIDLGLLPQLDMAGAEMRALVTLLGVGTLLYGLIWESNR